MRPGFFSEGCPSGIHDGGRDAGSALAIHRSPSTMNGEQFNIKKPSGLKDSERAAWPRRIPLAINGAMNFWVWAPLAQISDRPADRVTVLESKKGQAMTHHVLGV